MLQPITMSADGTLHLQDGQHLDTGQFQILGDPAVDGNMQAVAVDPTTIQQLQFDSLNGQIQVCTKL